MHLNDFLSSDERVKLRGSVTFNMSRDLHDLMITDKCVYIRSARDGDIKIIRYDAISCLTIGDRDGQVNIYLGAFNNSAFICLGISNDPAWAKTVAVCLKQCWDEAAR